MKQVFYSDVLDDYFDTEKECQNAEKAYEEKQKAIEVKKNEVSKQKKELADAIDEADKELNAAYSNLELIYTQANDILKEAREEANKLVSDGKAKLKEAQQKKFDAVSNFNKKFGVYTTQYSGERALEELRRANSWLNDIFGGFLF